MLELRVKAGVIFLDEFIQSFFCFRRFLLQKLVPPYKLFGFFKVFFSLFRYLVFFGRLEQLPPAFLFGNSGVYVEVGKETK
jgi:hypothetical protein